MNGYPDQQQVKQLPEQVQGAINVLLLSAENLREVIAVNDCRTSEAPIYGALAEIVNDLATGDHD
jgi:hypothetical protein